MIQFDSFFIQTVAYRPKQKIIHFSESIITKYEKSEKNSRFLVSKYMVKKESGWNFDWKALLEKFLN